MLHLYHGSFLHKRMGQATELLVYTVWIHIQTMLGEKNDPKGDMLLFVWLSWSGSYRNRKLVRMIAGGNELTTEQQHKEFWEDSVSWLRSSSSMSWFDACYSIVFIFLCDACVAHVCMHMCAGASPCMCMGMWRPERYSSSTILCPHHFFLFWDMTLSNQELTDLARLAGQWASGICLSPPLTTLELQERCAVPSFFHGCSGSELRFLCLCDRQFTTEPSP